MESSTPEVRFYLLSPAATILELAENALPILDLGDARDPVPRMKPIPNQEVPWEMLAESGRDPSPLWAGFFLFLTLAPLAGATLSLKRDRGRRAR
jgi:hypothetical protein